MEHYILSDDYDDMICTLLLTPGGGYFWEFLVRVCSPILQILTLFKPRNVIFHNGFQTRSLKSIPIFRLGQI